MVVVGNGSRGWGGEWVARAGSGDGGGGGEKKWWCGGGGCLSQLRCHDVAWLVARGVWLVARGALGEAAASSAAGLWGEGDMVRPTAVKVTARTERDVCGSLSLSLSHVPVCGWRK